MSEPTHDEIERRAYERWEQAGRPQGWDKEFYRLAERELRNQRCSDAAWKRSSEENQDGPKPDLQKWQYTKTH
jgi:hypothetical protein